MMTLQSEIRRILNENQIVKNASRKEFLGLYIPALTNFRGQRHILGERTLLLDIQEFSLVSIFKNIIQYANKSFQRPDLSFDY